MKKRPSQAQVSTGKLCRTIAADSFYVEELMLLYVLHKGKAERFSVGETVRLWCVADRMKMISFPLNQMTFEGFP